MVEPWIKKQKNQCNKDFIHNDTFIRKCQDDDEFRTFTTKSLDNINKGIYYGKDHMKRPESIKRKSNGNKIYIENFPVVGSVEIPATKLSVLVFTTFAGFGLILGILLHYGVIG